MVAQAPVIPQPPILDETRIPMSLEEFLALPETMHAEWVDGEAIIFMTTTDVHALAVVFLVRLLGDFAEEHEPGLVLTAPYGMRVRPDAPLREPDLMVLLSANRDRLGRLWIEGPADLVFEVISDDSAGRDRADKFYEYQHGGVPEYWIYDPRPRLQRLDGYRLGDDGRYLAIQPDANGRYRSSALPGFWLRLEWLTQEPLPRPKAILAEILGARQSPGDRSS
jgi:Uma2 family endonuclease